MVKGNKSSKSRKSGPSVQSQLNVLRRQLNGHIVKTSPDPKPYTQRPWNNITIAGVTTADEKGNIAFLNSDLYSLAHGQVNLAISDLMRIISIKVYVESNSPSDFIELNVKDLLRNGSELATVSDSAGRNHFASVGYSYPEAHTKAVIMYNDDLLFSGFVAPKSDVEVRIRCLWKFSGTEVPSSSTSLWRIKAH